MNAINLIPLDQRRSSGGGGRTGGAVYILLGALTALVAMAALFATASHTASTRTAKADRLAQRASATEQQAQSMKDYTAFAQLSKDRITTIQAIAKSRFDWAHVMREVARTIPGGVHLTSLKGSVTGGDSSSGAAPATTGAGGVAAGPTITIGGCATGDQKATARMMVALRQVDGVTNVQLNSSTQSQTGSAPAGATDSACHGPTFEVITTFTPPAVAAPTSSATP